MSKISTWMTKSGKLFVHIFTHQKHSYHFNKGWMAKTFFTGGTMPSHDLQIVSISTRGWLDSVCRAR